MRLIYIHIDVLQKVHVSVSETWPYKVTDFRCAPEIAYRTFQVDFGGAPDTEGRFNKEKNPPFPGDIYQNENGRITYLSIAQSW